MWREDWSEEKNFEVFGRCSNQNWHGHNFTILVTVKGIPHEDTGFVMNLKDLSAIIKQEVVEPLDHRNLNLDVPFMNGILASTENLIIKIWERIEEPIRQHGGELVKIKLEETENNYVEYFGGREIY